MSHLKNNVKRTKQINVRITIEQYILVNRMAIYDCVPMSSVIKMAINDYLRKRHFLKSESF